MQVYLIYFDKIEMQISHSLPKKEIEKLSIPRVKHLFGFYALIKQISDRILWKNQIAIV